MIGILEIECKWDGINPLEIKCKWDLSQKNPQLNILLFQTAIARNLMKNNAQFILKLLIHQSGLSQEVGVVFSVLKTANHPLKD